MNKSHTDNAIDPKSLVTPYAFKIAPNVLYKPLASPLKRILAIIVDGLLVAALAENAGWVFVLMVAITVVVQKRSRTMGKAVKWALYALMLVGMIFALVNYQEENRDSIQQSGEVQTINPQGGSGSETLQTLTELSNYLPEIIFASQCQDYECAQQRLVSVKDALSHSNLSAIEQTRILQELINDLPLSEQENNALNAQLIETGIKELPIKSNDESIAAEAFIGDSVTDAPAKVDQDDWQAEADVSDSDSNSAEDPKSSPLAWLIGSLNDLGLGFGWAAFYFTVFTAWFDGQTLGKKLLGISVIQLDGSKITLWAAFGRYGGYAAGFTTGLLGFIQIFWDANRQAIQDKISATVVIDLRKIPLEHPEDKITVNTLNAPTHTKVAAK
ncbi:transporter [Shewanella sp. Choline-02u-19]|uniref:RDD family protein n=1 Tax=unclassified Shewanella TaxID=196818 RepID=UPI000C33C97E|nr:MULTISPECIES: RDD family protein [unclassified Shewanella]PKH55855.1 transporter [Shewanella sp. Bg11-22]PKI27219.1 transporter [Shewanella sp. Choline-02u-19]